MIKRIFIIFGILLLLLIGALVTVALVVDPNDYKDKIRDLAREATGRELEIIDDMELSVFPWLGVEFGEVRLSNAEGFGAEPFARIDRARVKVRLIPLISRRIELDTIILDGLEVRLAVAEDGRTNWDDLAGAADSPEETRPEPVPAAPADPSAPALALPAMLTISGLEIRDAALHWRDAAADQSFDVTGIYLESGRIEANRPIDIELKFALDSQQPALSAEVELDSRITARPADETYRFEDLRLQARLDGDALPVRPARFELGANLGIDLGRQTLEIAPLSLSVLDLEASGELRGQGILDEPQLTGTLEIAEFDPRALLEDHLETEIETTDPKVLSSAALALAFDAGTTSADIRQLEVRLDDSLLRGSASLRNFSDPAIDFDLALDQIDVDRYLTPTEEVPAATPATAPAAALELPLETLRDLDVDGSVSIDRLTAGGLKMSEFRIEVRAKDGILEASPIDAALYGGRYRGNVRLDARGDTPEFSIDEELAGVEAEPLLKDMLDLDLVSGIADFRIEATARGTSADMLRRSVDGAAKFRFRDGAIKGFNIAQMVRDVRARLEGRSAAENAPRKTDFTELAGSLDIDNGVVRNDDLRGSSPYLRIAGSGQADLVKERIDYRLQARFVETPAGQGTALEDVKGIDIPVRIRGPLTAPAIEIDADFLRELLRSKLSPKVDEAREELEDKTEQRKRELEEQLRDKANEQLRKLLR